MRTPLILTVFTICTPVICQQEYGISPGGTAFTSRGTLGTGAGELLQGVHASHHRGVGEVAGACKIDGALRVTLQDQNGATAQTYSLIVRGGTDAAGPGIGFAGVGPFTLPASGTGPRAWLVTHTLTAPIPLPGCASFFAFGVQLPAARNWSADGLSCHMALMSSQCSHARQGDHAWQVNASGIVSHPPGRLSWNFFFRVKNAAVLQLGNGGTSYGMGGMFPKVGCALTARSRFPAATFDNGTSLLYGALTRTPGVVLIPGSVKVYLGSGLVFFGVRPAPSGQAVHTISGSLPATPPGLMIHFQAIGVKGTNRAVTNCHSLTL